MHKYSKKKFYLLRFTPVIIFFFFLISFFSISNNEKKIQVYQFLLSANQSLSIPLLYSDYRSVYSFIHNLKNLKIKNEFEKINIILNKKNYNALSNEVNRLKKTAIKGAILVKGKEPKRFKAKINYKNNSIPATIELKGLHISHIKYDNSWSLEIKLKKGFTINGFKKFSIQNFNERQFPYNAILGEIYAEQDFTTKAYFPIKVQLNGLNWGVMYAEEEFSETFFERRKIKNPFLFTIGDKRKFESTYERLKSNNLDTDYKKVFDYVDSDLRNFFDIKISGKNLKKNISIDLTSLNEIKKNVYQIINLDHKILYGSKFNLLEEDFIRLYSLSIIFCENHSIADFNLNYFLNHYNHKIGLIPGDFSFNNYPNYKPYKSKIYKKHKKNNCNLEKLLESYDYKFKRLIKKKENIEKIVFFVEKNYDQLIDLYNLKLYNKSQSFNFDYEFFKIKKIKEYEKKVKKNINLLSKKNNILEKNLNFKSLRKIEEQKIDFFHEEDNIYFVNLTRQPIQLNSIEVDEVDVLELNYNLGKSNFNNLSKFKMNNSESLSGKKIKLNFNYSKNNFSKEIRFENFYLSNLENFLILKNKDTFTFSKKDMVISRPLIIPHGFNLYVNEGTRIKFSENSYILLLGGKITLNGTKKNQIILQGLNKDKFWKGLHVIHNEKDFSEINNVYFENLDFHKSKFKLTGGLNFYEGQVNLTNVSIYNCNSEDCINIVKSTSNLNNVNITKTNSDAIDFDFSKGNIKNLYLKDIGGDALDFSGSEFSIKNSIIINAFDKGISNGEASKLKIDSIQVSKSDIAIANKDGSYLLGKNIVSLDNNLDIAAYQKKSFYDHTSFLEVTDFKSEPKVYLEDGHHIKINNQIIKSNISEKRKIIK